MKPLFILFVIATLFLGSCTGPSVVTEQVIDLPSGGWKSDSSIAFDFVIEDKSKKYDFLYILRTEQRYPFCNLFLRYTLTDSLGSIIETRLDEMMVSDPKTGELKGSGFGDVREHLFLFLQNKSLPYAGGYTLELKQYMRVDSLPYLISAGIKVQETDVSIRP